MQKQGASLNTKKDNRPVTDFRLSRLFIVDVDSALECLHRVDVGCIATVSEVHAASIFSFEVSRMSECSCMCRF
jgi:hypothetical protein